jgi:hypothetical protein
MEKNGKGMTPLELESLQEVYDVVLWQDDNGPTMVTDMNGVDWFIGLYCGELSKRKAR